MAIICGCSCMDLEDMYRSRENGERNRERKCVINCLMYVIKQHVSAVHLASAMSQK